jgi:hypothetical protein
LIIGRKSIKNQGRTYYVLKLALKDMAREKENLRKDATGEAVHSFIS